MTTNLAIFDLDNTLIAGDSDSAWGNFLVSKGVVDRDQYAEKNQRFYAEYQRGDLDIEAYLAFALKPLKDNSIKDLHAWRDEFMQTVIEPLLLPKAMDLIAQHRQQHHTLLIITATNTFITAPIAEKLGIENLIGTEPEIISQKYTGKVSGTPSFQAGKIARLDNWLKEKNITLQHTWFYSDSLNDLPLLEKVDTPVAVDPDDTLAAFAKQKQWDIISLR